MGQLGFRNVFDATDGEMALDILKQNKDIKLVISDWNMGKMTGLELLKEVRRSPELRHLPFIMVTAESKLDNVLVAKEAGVSNYIVKPFTSVTLKKKLESVLGKF